MEWVTTLNKNLLCGPYPRTKEQVDFLVMKKCVSHFICIAPETKDKLPKYSEHIGAIIKDDKKHRLQIFPVIHTCHCDNENYVAKGRLKKDQQHDLAMFYIHHAQKIIVYLTKYAEPTSIVYIHKKTGLLEEAYVAFALWVLLGYDSHLPNDPLRWIKENSYEMLFNDQEEEKNLLGIIWAEAKSIVRAQKMFGTKKQKTTKEEEGQ